MQQKNLKSMFCNVFYILFFSPPTLHCKLNNISLTTVQFSLNVFMNEQNHSPAITDNGQPQ